MLSFPQGYFSGMTCLADLLLPQNYLSGSQEWYQSSESTEGLLGAAPLHLPLSPHLAALNILYHYMFKVGPALVPANLKMLLHEPIASLQVTAEDRSPTSSFNSGLFRDTCVAHFVLQRQSGGEEGKKLLSAAFSSQEIEKFMPPYTFPLQIDTAGSLNLPEEPGFDRNLVREFLDALYKTNIAGIESMQIGSTVIHRMQTSIEQSIARVSSLREELRSVRQSIESLSGATNDKKRDKKLGQLKEQAAVLEKITEGRRGTPRAFSQNKSQSKYSCLEWKGSGKEQL